MIGSPCPSDMLEKYGTLDMGALDLCKHGWTLNESATYCRSVGIRAVDPDSTGSLDPDPDPGARKWTLKFFIYFLFLSARLSKL